VAPLAPRTNARAAGDPGSTLATDAGTLSVSRGAPCGEDRRAARHGDALSRPEGVQRRRRPRRQRRDGRRDRRAGVPAGARAGPLVVRRLRRHRRASRRGARAPRARGRDRRRPRLQRGTKRRGDAWRTGHARLARRRRSRRVGSRRLQRRHPRVRARHRHAWRRHCGCGERRSRERARALVAIAGARAPALRAPRRSRRRDLSRPVRSGSARGVLRRRFGGVLRRPGGARGRATSPVPSARRVLPPGSGAAAIKEGPRGPSFILVRSPTPSPARPSACRSCAAAGCRARACLRHRRRPSGGRLRPGGRTTARRRGRGGSCPGSGAASAVRP